LQCNLSKYIAQIRLYCSKQLETTFYSFCEKPLHITFNVNANLLTNKRQPVEEDKLPTEMQMATGLTQQ